MKKSSKFCKLAVLAGVLPFIYGCGSGGGTGALLGFLFGGSGIGGAFALLGGAAATGVSTALTSGGGTELATLYQPEPASMLLLGSGLVAMTYFKAKTDRRNKK